MYDKWITQKICVRKSLISILFSLTDTIAQRGERLELLIDKAEDLNTTVSFLL